MNRSGAAPFTSSIEKSLRAWRHSSATSMSVDFRKILPAQPRELGKHSCVPMPSESVSFSRIATWFTISTVSEYKCYAE